MERFTRVALKALVATALVCTAPVIADNSKRIDWTGTWLERVRNTQSQPSKDKGRGEALKEAAKKVVDRFERDNTSAKKEPEDKSKKALELAKKAQEEREKKAREVAKKQQEEKKAQEEREKKAREVVKKQQEERAKKALELAKKAQEEREKKAQEVAKKKKAEEEKKKWRERFDDFEDLMDDHLGYRDRENGEDDDMGMGPGGKPGRGMPGGDKPPVSDVPVPEPSTYFLLGAFIAFAMASRRRRQKRKL